jgi:hypothetical protein
MMQIHHDGLLQTTQRQTVNTRTTIRTTLPMQLFKSHWERHQLTGADVRKVLDNLTPFEVWTAVVLHQGVISGSATKASFASKTGVLISSKLIGIKKLMKLQNCTFGNGSNRIYKSSVKVLHTPAMPSTVVPSAIMRQLRSSVAPQLSINRITAVPRSFEFYQLQWIPLSVHDQYLRLARIHLNSDFDASGKGGDGSNLALQPYKVQIDEVLYTVSEECIMVTQ